ncbi:hypothetical protein E3P77_03232 [Wallemia ichthyophaga]|nr:hypothetical protein E3P77_03232 [Wallemia ichthyophaga]
MAHFPQHRHISAKARRYVVKYKQPIEYRVTYLAKVSDDCSEHLSGLGLRRKNSAIASKFFVQQTAQTSGIRVLARSIAACGIIWPVDLELSTFTKLTPP